MPDSFSQRHKLAGPPAGTLLRNEVPPSFRMFLIDLSHDSHSSFDLLEMQAIICRVLRIFPHPNGTPSFHCRKHIKECEWFFVYDIIEGLYKCVHEKTCLYNPGAAHSFAERANKALIEDNIGWQLVYGKVIARGDEAFEDTVQTASGVLSIVVPGIQTRQ